MSKSKYPGKIDGHKEIPVLRDNIIQSGTAAVNALRSAIIQIEKTLGINPNGEDGNSVASRLNRSLDEAGNIKDEALDYLNLLKGPISDSDVKEDAKISEGKLDLNFSTSFLYNQVIASYRNIEELSSQLENLSATLSSHLNKSALGRHNAKNINVEEITAASSDDAITETAEVSLQSLISSLFSSHINYSGANIGEVNRSHKANQIFYDKSLVSKLDSDSVQGALDDLANKENLEIQEHQYGLHSNSKIKIIKEEEVLLESVDCTFSRYQYSDSGYGTSFVMTTPIQDPGLKNTDYIKVVRGLDEYYFGIRTISYDSSSDITQIITLEDSIFSDSGSEVSLVRLSITDDGSALNLSRAERSSFTNADTIFLTSPTAPSVYSNYVNYKKINSSNCNLSIEVKTAEGNSSTYNINFLPTGTITLYSIVERINERFSEQNAPLLCYIDFEDRERFYISHMLEADATRSIKIVSASDNAYVDLGLSDFFEKEILKSDFGSLLVGGKRVSSIKAKLKTELFAVEPSNQITFIGLDDLYNYNIKTGDYLVLEGTASDDGAYRISSVSDSNLSVVRSGNFTGQSQGSGATVTIKSSSINLSSELSAPDVGIYDLYLNRNYEFIYNRSLVYSPSSNSSLYDNFKINNLRYSSSESSSLSIYLDNSNHLHVSISNEDVVLSTIDKSSYYIYSEAGNKLSFYIDSYSDLLSYVTANGTQNISFEVFSSSESNEGLKIGSVCFEPSGGKIMGREYFYPNKEVSYGSIGKKDISKEVIEDFFKAYRSQSSQNSVVYGCEVHSVLDDGSGNYKFSVDAGQVFVGGEIIEVVGSTIESEIDFSTYDRLYVGVNSKGSIVFESANLSGCNCPFDESNIVTLAVINYNITFGFENIDLRVFLGEFNSPALGCVYINSDKSKRNFRSINSAIKYAKNISKISDYVGVPKIIFSPGTHNLCVEHSGILEANSSDKLNFKEIAEDIYDQGLYIDFPVIIEGFGDSTVLSFSSKWSDSSSSDNSNSVNEGKIFIAGERMASGPYALSRLGAQNLAGNVLFKNLHIENTKIFVIDNNNSTKDEALYSDTVIEFYKVTFSRSNFGSFLSIHSNQSSYSYFHNKYFFSRCKLKNSSINFSNNDSDTTAAPFDQLSKLIISKSSIIKYTSSSEKLISTPRPVAADDKIYGLILKDNSIADVLSTGFYLFGNRDFYENFGSESEIKILAKNSEIEAVSETFRVNTAADSSISSSSVSIESTSGQLYLASSGGNVDLESSAGNDINIDSGSDLNLSSALNQNINISAGTSGYVNIGGANSYSVIGRETKGINVSMNGTDATINTTNLTVDSDTTFNGDVTFTNPKYSYSKSLAFVRTSTATGGLYLVGYEATAIAVAGNSFTTESLAFGSIVDNVNQYGQFIIPKRDGSIKSAMVINKGAGSSNIHAFFIHEYSGSGAIDDPANYTKRSFAACTLGSNGTVLDLTLSNTSLTGGTPYLISLYSIITAAVATNIQMQIIIEEG